MISQIIIRTFYKVKEGGETQLIMNSDAQVVFVLIFKEMSYLVVGVFDNVVGPFLYLYL